MEKQKLMPEFQTLQEMADFWETHDLMDYEDQLVQAAEPIFDLPAQTITDRPQTNVWRENAG